MSTKLTDWPIFGRICALSGKQLVSAGALSLRVGMGRNPPASYLSLSGPPANSRRFFLGEWFVSWCGVERIGITRSRGHAEKVGGLAGLTHTRPDIAGIASCHQLTDHSAGDTSRITAAGVASRGSKWQRATRMPSRRVCERPHKLMAPATLPQRGIATFGYARSGRQSKARPGS